MRIPLLLCACVVALVGMGCGNSSTSARESYLKEVADAGGDFVSDDAALAYLKRYCSAPGTRATPDAVDEAAAPYCSDEELAAELGYSTEAPTTSVPGVDEAAFRAEALQRFGIGAPEADGSRMDAVESAQSLCESADWSAMRSNLGARWDDSFQKFAAETFCPDEVAG